MSAYKRKKIELKTKNTLIQIWVPLYQENTRTQTQKICWYPFSWHISTSSTQLSSTSLWAQFMYHIILYWPKPMRHMGEIEEVWFGGYGSISFGPFTCARPCVLPSGQRTLVAPQAHGGSLVPKISISKEFSCSGWLRPKISTRTCFCL